MFARWLSVRCLTRWNAASIVRRRCSSLISKSPKGIESIGVPSTTAFPAIATIAPSSRHAISRPAATTCAITPARSDPLPPRYRRKSDSSSLIDTNHSKETPVNQSYRITSTVEAHTFISPQGL